MTYLFYIKSNSENIRKNHSIKFHSIPYSMISFSKFDFYQWHYHFATEQQSSFWLFFGIACVLIEAQGKQRQI